METYITSHIGIIILILISNSSRPFYNLYEYSGARAIKQLIRPPSKKELEDDNYRNPSTFVLWIFSIYIAIFGLASNRYERAVSTHEMQMASFQTQMSTDLKGYSCAKIPKLQKATIPLEPNLFNIWQTILSFFKVTKYKRGQTLIIDTLESYKNVLTRARLSQCDLSNADFSNGNLAKSSFYQSNLIGTYFSWSNLEKASFVKANCTQIHFFGTNLKKATINKADLTSAIIVGSNLSYAQLRKSKAANATIVATNFSHARLDQAKISYSEMTECDFQFANMKNAIFLGTNLRKSDFISANLTNVTFVEADLTDTVNLTPKQLSQSKTLYKAKLPKKIEKELRETHPHLFKKPDWYKEDET
ncbi:pentapeptide repeat-containing protein [Maridesulfovibrio sp.]|uniref:pentapeptide repeat-containing protein n=1 Tax=Maridesulfovibrio sp. TaxID=2795000 RepID=UPI003BA9F457